MQIMNQTLNRYLRHPNFIFKYEPDSATAPLTKLTIFISNLKFFSLRDFSEFPDAEVDYKGTIRVFGMKKSFSISKV